MNKANLLGALADAEDLLAECGWEDRVAWLRERRSKLEALSPGSDEFRVQLETLRQVLVGMGSFADLPLDPRAGSNMSAREAQDKQWELTERIGAAVDELLARAAVP